MSVNVDSIVLIKILSQLPQFSMKIQKEHLERGSLYVL